MHVTYKGRIADLADLRDGSVFLADLDGRPIVRATKAFHVSPSGIHGGKIVTVGPFRGEDEGKPGVYEPHFVRRLVVVDLTGGARLHLPDRAGGRHVRAAAFARMPRAGRPCVST